MTNTRFARAQWAATISIVAAIAACSTDAPADTSEGAVAMTASALSSSNVAKVTITITAPDIATPIVTNLVKVGGKWQGVIGKIPAGLNRQFHGDAYTAGNAIVYAGDVSGVTITKNTTSAVAMLLQQSAAPVPFQNAAPVIDGMVASSNGAAVGDSIVFSLAAHDVDPGDMLTYDWSATGGVVVATPDGRGATWSAPSTVGDYTIIARVTDSKGSIAAMAFAAKADSGRGRAAVNATFNTWPLVSGIVATPSRIDVGAITAIALNASDVDGDAVTYAWTSSCAGTFSDPAARNPSFTLSALPPSGTCDLNVSVSDGRGGINTGRLTIKAGPAPVADVAPQVDTTFQSSATAANGEAATVSLTAHDPNGGAIGISWSSDIGTLAPPTSSGPGQSSVTWTAASCFSRGLVATVTATITDSTGAVTTETFKVRSMTTRGCAFVFAGDLANHTLVKYDLAGTRLATYPGLTYAGGMAIGADGKIWIAEDNLNDAGSRIVRFDPSTGAALGVFVSLPGTTFNEGVAFGGDGNLYVSGGGRIRRFNPQTGAALSDLAPDSAGPDLENALGIAAGPDGNIYMTGLKRTPDRNTGAIVRYKTDGTYLGLFADSGGGNGPRRPTWDVAGNLYTANLNDGKVWRYASNGTPLGVFATLPSNGTVGSEFLPNGDIVVPSVWTNTIYRVNSAGQNVGNFATNIQASTMVVW